MRIGNIIMIWASVLVAGLTSCSFEGSDSVLADSSHKVSQMTEDALEGELLVRFDPRVSSILDKAGLTKSGPGFPMKRSGILSVDEILDLVGGYHIERVFPVDARSEEKARNEGLHLWYLVRFSDAHSVEKVASDIKSVCRSFNACEHNLTA